MKLVIIFTNIVLVLTIRAAALPMKTLVRALPSKNSPNRNGSNRSVSQPAVSIEHSSNASNRSHNRVQNANGSQTRRAPGMEIMMHRGYWPTKEELAESKRLQETPPDPEYVENIAWLAAQAKSSKKGNGSSNPKKQKNTNLQQNSRKSPRYADEDEATLTDKTTRDEVNSKAEGGLAGIKEMTGSQTWSSPIAGDNVSEDGGYTSDDTLVSQGDKSHTK